MNRVVLCSILLCCLAQLVAAARPEAVLTRLLHDGWRFRQAGEAEWHPAKVPGCVHTDLIDNRLIPDPYYRTVEKDLQWIGEKDWEYETHFSVESSMIPRKHIQLVFHGLDTYARVYLNEQLILSADNMFRTWFVDVRSYLKPGINSLRICFTSVFAVNLPRWQSAPFRLKAFANNDQANVQINMYSRKAGFHYGWDWGPRLITCGIWRPVELQAWDEVHLDDLQIDQNRLDDDRADLTARFVINSDGRRKVKLFLLLDGKSLLRKRVTLNPGRQQISLPFVIKKPKRWWCNGLGEAHLYQFKGALKEGHQQAQVISQRIGLRTLNVVRDRDQAGQSFYIRLNGVPVFMKGANYIPQDNFQNRVSPARFEHMIRSAAAANMNMLRVWGGGIYEDDRFYDLCDEYGILIWQEMMFACGMYPADEAFLDNVRAEVRDNAKRLRHHPCLALYCGNNENEISWYAWGWKNEFPPEVQKQYEAELYRLFHEVIPQALAEVDPDRYYHPTSPIAGFEGRANADGDIHYWGVWHGREPFSSFEKNIARFVSEYGFQSYPEAATVDSFTQPEDRQLHSEVMLAHQRCMADDRRDREYGNRLIQSYLEQLYRQPQTFDDYLYLSQVLQAEGVRQAIEAHRRNKPFCMGSLYWQIDDCWPVASWSSIDYYGRWKALHYFARKAYAPWLVSVTGEGDSFQVHVVSDELTDETVELLMRTTNFQGRMIHEERMAVRVAANSVASCYTGKADEWLQGIAPTAAALRLTLRAGGDTLASAVHYFAAVKDLDLPRPGVSVRAEKTVDGFRLCCESDVLAKNILLSCDDPDATFSDNYFDLWPGERVILDFRSSCKDVEPPAGLHIRTLRDTYP